jgi:two-component system, sensor histidine kinase
MEIVMKNPPVFELPESALTIRPALFEPADRDMNDMFQSSGCEVIAAKSGREAMMLLADSTRVPDFLVCDCQLKGEQTGAQVIRQLREGFNCDIPAMLVTGNTSGGAAERSARELAIPVLHKPLEAHALRSVLETLLVAEEQ